MKSHPLIARSPDLVQLRNEGYHLEIFGGYLLAHDIPYVDEARKVHRGILVSPLLLKGDVTAKPDTHVAYWFGAHPCHHDGRKIKAFENFSPPPNLGDGRSPNFTFSAKADYRDYHHKMTTYVARITAEAQVLEPGATAQTYPVVISEEEDAVFRYIDTASSRVGTVDLNKRLARHRIGIVGLGGTGSYVFDLVAKTWVSEIHLFDDDFLYQHNAYRAPGAASLDELQSAPKKVDYLAGIYGKMRQGICPHPIRLGANSVERLKGLDFVFLCMDSGAAKKDIVQFLMAAGIPFIDVGIGILRTGNSLTGLMRVTSCIGDNRDQAVKHIGFAEDDVGENDYSTNIQIAELNAFNAALAVIQWKKSLGFYRDSSNAHSFNYSISANEIMNEEAA